MDIIVCGSGVVGRGIARQLALEGNNVTVLDDHAGNINSIQESLDVTAVKGFPSHPTALIEAGANDTEMIIAVTLSDEVNMVICQLAHSIFNIPIKIARVRHQNYLRPLFKELYARDHLPIDHIISPEREVASAVVSRLRVPGALTVIPFAEERFHTVEVRIEPESPLVGESIPSLYQSFDNPIMRVAGILRNEQFIIPNDNEVLLAGDELYFVARSEYVRTVMTKLGYGGKEARRIIIVGGGNIGVYIAEELEQEDEDINLKIIELDKERAEYAASTLSKTTVLYGSALDGNLLKEANISNTETMIAVTNDDEVNILCSLLGKRYGCNKVFTLINKGQSYDPLIASIGIDVTINPREVTVSGILRHTRKGQVSAAYSIAGGQAELLETIATKEANFLGKSIAALDLPKGIEVVAMLRGDDAIFPNEETYIEQDDHLIVVAETAQVQKLDKIFEATPEFY